MRCVSCNKQLSFVESSGTKPDKTPEDMCAVCRYKAFQEMFDGETVWDNPLETELTADLFLKNNGGYTEEEFKTLYLGDWTDE